MGAVCVPEVRPGRHRAGLNYGDCFSYALSKVTGEGLLYVGEGFGATDVVRALEK